MARESNRETGEEICERLNVRPELRNEVMYHLDDASIITWRLNNLFVDFLKECLAEDDLKGMIALDAATLMDIPGACIHEEQYFDLFKDIVNACYEINDMYIIYFLGWVIESEDLEINWTHFLNAFRTTLRDEHVQRRFGHSLKDLTIDEFKQLLVETPGYQEDARLREFVFDPEKNEDALEAFQQEDSLRDVERRPKVLERRRDLLRLIDMGQRRGEREDREHQKQLRRAQKMREREDRKHQKQLRRLSEMQVATAVEQYAEPIIRGYKRGGGASEGDVKRPRK